MSDCIPHLNGKPTTYEALKKELVNNRALLTKYVDGAKTEVPEMPFKKGWETLAMRRMIRKASEEGYDAISWDTGETQAARYDLSKHVDKISWNPEYGTLIGLRDGQEVISQSGVTKEKLPNHIGKSAAEKMEAAGPPRYYINHGAADSIVKNQDGEFVMRGEANEVRRWVKQQEKTGGGIRSISGDDLRIDAAGMKGFYDKILPSVANDIGKKFGSRVEEAEVRAGEEPDPSTPHDVMRPKNAKVHQLKITPEMRESVMKEGFPQFMPSPDLWKGLDRHLTPEERASVRERDIPKIVSAFKAIEKHAEGAKAALAGADQKHWYTNSTKAIIDTFGPDADRFAALLASLSPQASVADNMRNAVSTWRAWIEAGRPTDRTSIDDILSGAVTVTEGKKAMSAYSGNTFRSLSAENPAEVQLSGAKVDSFMKNLRGNVTEATNDRWMGKYAGLDEHGLGKNDARAREGMKIKGFNYLALNAHLRRLSVELTKQTGEAWTAPETQAAIWSYVKSKSDGTSMADIPVFDKLLKELNAEGLADLQNPF